MNQPTSVEVSDLSSITIEEARELLGLSIVGVRAYEYRLILELSNGRSLEVEGNSYDGSVLSVCWVNS